MATDTRWNVAGHEHPQTGDLHCVACATAAGWTADPAAQVGEGQTAVTEMDLDVATDFGQGPRFVCVACCAVIREG